MTSGDYEHEIKEAIEFLKDKFPSQKVITFAAAYNTVTLSFLDYLDEHSISCRIGTNGEQASLSQEFDMYSVKAFGFNENSNFEFLQAQTAQLIDEGAWVVYFFHTVTSGAPYEDVGTSKSVLDAHCKALYDKYNGSVWFGSFEDVSIYAKQLKDVKITPTSLNGGTMAFNVSTTLDTEIYNVPMSMKMYVPSNATSVCAKVNSEAQETKIHSDEGGKYIYVLDVPTDNSTVEIIYQ
ncbi:MAG: hypothetical protein IJC80_02660 [Clostridia bacterium]|nr:hypothetical protein [Clostridia bacterium]